MWREAGESRWEPMWREAGNVGGRVSAIHPCIATGRFRDVHSSLRKPVAGCPVLSSITGGALCTFAVAQRWRRGRVLRDVR